MKNMSSFFPPLNSNVGNEKMMEKSRYPGIFFVKKYINVMKTWLVLSLEAATGLVKRGNGRGDKGLGNQDWNKRWRSENEVIRDEGKARSVPRGG